MHNLSRRYFGQGSRGGVPSFSTINKTMKIHRSLVVLDGLADIFFLLKEFLKRTKSMMKLRMQINHKVQSRKSMMKFRRTKKVGKFVVQKAKNKGAVSNIVGRVAISPRVVSDHLTFNTPHASLWRKGKMPNSQEHSMSRVGSHYV